MKPIIKKTFIFHLNGWSAFYRQSDLNRVHDALCVGFVQKFGVSALNIKLHVSSSRPGKKGWRKVYLKDARLEMNGELFAMLEWQERLFVEAQQNYGWIKIEPAY